MGRVRRYCAHHTMGGNHNHQRLVVIKNDRQPRSAATNRPQATRSVREGAQVLARVRREREAGCGSSAHFIALLWSLRLRRRHHEAGDMQHGTRDRASRGPETMVESPYRVGLPQPHSAPPSERAGAAHNRDPNRAVRRTRTHTPNSCRLRLRRAEIPIPPHCRPGSTSWAAGGLETRCPCARSGYDEFIRQDAVESAHGCEGRR
ncbi:hypothetical protein M3J09_013468 [Ascochyta lentis]